MLFSMDCLRSLSLVCKYAVVCTFVCCSPEVPNIPHKAELQSAFRGDKIEYVNWMSSSDTFPKFAQLLSLPTYSYHILLGLTISTGGLTESLVRFHLTIVLYCICVRQKYCFEECLIIHIYLELLACSIMLFFLFIKC